MRGTPRRSQIVASVLAPVEPAAAVAPPLWLSSVPSIESAVTDRRPWYEPSEKLPDEPVINAPMLKEFDSVVVEMSDARNAKATS